MTVSAQQVLQSSVLSGSLTATDSSSIASSATPVDPTSAQQQFLQAMSAGNVAPTTNPYSVNYTEQYLQDVAQNLTSATVTSQTATAYPQARAILAGWYSLLTPQEQATAASQLSAISPGINTSTLAQQDTTNAGPSALPGGNPSAAAKAEADKIPNASVNQALNDVISAMDPSLYPAAGKIAMNSQLISSIISEGITLIGYLTQNAKDAINGDNA
jgi:hypothetical protein